MSTIVVRHLEPEGIDGGFVRMIERFRKEGTLTGDLEADDFLRRSGEAVLLGLLFDQRVLAEVAFTGPLRLHDRLGHLDFRKIAKMDLDDLRRAFAKKPAVHRFTNRMAGFTLDLAKEITRRYGGRAARVWEDAASREVIRKRVADLPGFGPGKAAKCPYVLHYFGHRDFATQPD